MRVINERIMDCSGFSSPCNSQVINDDDPRKKNKKKHWSAIESTYLLLMVLPYSHNICWDEVLKDMKKRIINFDKTEADCIDRWEKQVNPMISKTGWTAEEDAKLGALVEKYGIRSWMTIARLMENKTDTQCRYHYFKYIVPNLKKCSQTKAPRMSIPPTFAFAQSVIIPQEPVAINTQQTSTSINTPLTQEQDTYDAFISAYPEKAGSITREMFYEIKSFLLNHE